MKNSQETTYYSFPMHRCYLKIWNATLMVCCQFMFSWTSHHPNCWDEKPSLRLHVHFTYTPYIPAPFWHLISHKPWNCFSEAPTAQKHIFLIGSFHPQWSSWISFGPPKKFVLNIPMHKYEITYIRIYIKYILFYFLYIIYNI